MYYTHTHHACILAESYSALKITFKYLYIVCDTVQSNN